MVFARKIILTMFILMKPIIFICRGRHEGIANVETYRDIQGQTGTYRDRQGDKRTSRDKHGPTRTIRDKQGQKENVPFCPCPVPACPCFVPACP